MLSGEIWLVLVAVAIAGALIMARLWRTAEGRVVESNWRAVKIETFWADVVVIPFVAMRFILTMPFS